MRGTKIRYNGTLSEKTLQSINVFVNRRSKAKKNKLPDGMENDEEPVKIDEETEKTEVE
tara:strand:+ start:13864 stop:14040 length:177 start_codon:yes stop_codon:yes gene_type:complete